jgi:hypothetical protein
MVAFPTTRASAGSTSVRRSPTEKPDKNHAQTSVKCELGISGAPKQAMFWHSVPWRGVSHPLHSRAGANKSQTAGSQRRLKHLCCLSVGLRECHTHLPTRHTICKLTCCGACAAMTMSRFATGIMLTCEFEAFLIVLTSPLLATSAEVAHRASFCTCHTPQLPKGTSIWPGIFLQPCDVCPFTRYGPGFTKLHCHLSCNTISKRCIQSP